MGRAALLPVFRARLSSVGLRVSLHQRNCPMGGRRAAAFESAPETGQGIECTGLNGTGWAWPWRSPRSQAYAPGPPSPRPRRLPPPSCARRSMPPPSHPPRSPRSRCATSRCRANVRPIPKAACRPMRRPRWGLRGSLFASRATFKHIVRPVSGPFAVAPTSSTSADDTAAVKRVIEATRKGKEADADAAEKSISDPVARKLAEWIILRSDNTKPSFQRYATFVSTNPSWPHSPLFTRRAENALWNDRLDDSTVLSFFANRKPVTAKGRYMLAHALLAKGDREGAAALVRHAWRYEDCSGDVEKRVLEMFGDLLTREDHKVRMEKRFYADDTEAGMRAAARLGGHELEIGHARAGVIKQLNNAKALLDAVPAAARSDPGYIFARVQWLRRANKLGRSRQAHPHRAARCGVAGGYQSMVAGTAHPGAQAARRSRRANRLPRGARRRAADARQLARRSAFHRRLDRLALFARSENRRRPFRADHPRHRQPACAGARRLLARPRRRRHGPARAGQGLLRGSRQAHRNVLRPARARAAGLHRSGLARPACLHAGRAQSAEQARNRPRGGNPLLAQ